MSKGRRLKRAAIRDAPEWMSQAGRQAGRQAGQSYLLLIEVDSFIHENEGDLMTDFLARKRQSRYLIRGAMSEWKNPATGCLKTEFEDGKINVSIFEIISLPKTGLECSSTTTTVRRSTAAAAAAAAAVGLWFLFFQQTLSGVCLQFSGSGRDNPQQSQSTNIVHCSD